MAIGKNLHTVKGKKLNQAGVWPIVIVCTEFNLKIEANYDESKNLYVVNANGQPYYNLPYLAPNHNYGSEEEEFLRATVVMNGLQILNQQTLHWNFFDMETKIEKAIQINELKTLQVQNLECKALVANEILDLIIGQNISEVDGLSEITLSGFKETCAPFD